MKSSILKTLLLVGLSAIGAAGLQAQPTPKIAVVDLAKLFDGFWKTKFESDKINAEKNDAQGKANIILQSRADEIKQAQQLYNEASNNPAIINDPKSKANVEKQLNDWSTDITAKENSLRSLNADITNTIQKEQADYKNLAITEITQVATRIAKSHGANMLIDSSKSTTYQTSAFLFIAPDFSDITDEVLKDLNRDAPPAAPVAPAADTKK